MATAPGSLEAKIDDLVKALGGLERLRELSRLSSLDHLVNLHLLSHLTRLDKIEGLDKLKALDELRSLEKLDNLTQLEELRGLNRLTELRQLEELGKLASLTSLDRLSELDRLSQLDQLSQLDKLLELQKLGALDSLSNLGGLERLDHLKYLESLDRLQELTALTKLEDLAGLKDLLEKNSERLNQLRHLDALDNLPLLNKLDNLDRLDRLDELKLLDRLTELRELDRLTALSEAPPPPASPAAAPVPQPAPVVERVIERVDAPVARWQEQLLRLGFELVRTFFVALLVTLALVAPSGQRVLKEATSYLGLGGPAQVAWALGVLREAEGGGFAQHWVDFQQRIDNELGLLFETAAPWPVSQRRALLRALLSYDFQHDGVSLREAIRTKLRERVALFESQWGSRLNRELGQLMLSQRDPAQVSLLNQLKELSISARWENLVRLAEDHPESLLAQEALILGLTRLELEDEAKR